MLDRRARACAPGHTPGHMHASCRSKHLCAVLHLSESLRLPLLLLLELLADDESRLLRGRGRRARVRAQDAQGAPHGTRRTVSAVCSLVRSPVTAPSMPALSRRADAGEHHVARARRCKGRRSPHAVHVRGVHSAGR